MDQTTTGHKSPWQLNFLSGPMMGRSMSLSLGENWVGSSAECDVILPDRDVAARHLRLHVGHIAVSIQNATDAAATLNGEALGAGRRTLVPGDVVGAGSIRFGIQWAAPALAVPPEYEQAAVAAHNSPLLAWASGVPGALARIDVRKWLLGVLLAWAVLALAAGGYYVVTRRGNAQWAGANQFERIRMVQQALAGYPELTVAPGDGGKLVISGYLPTAGERERVQHVIEPFGGVTLGKIYNVDRMVAEARQYFSDTPLSVSYGGHGKLVISGVAPPAGSAALAQRIRNFQHDAAPAAKVIDEVQYRGAQGPVNLGSGAPLPEIVGVYQDDSGTRFIQTQNGEHFFEGAQMRDGLKIVSIAPDTVVFERGGQKIVWHIAGPGQP
ncbi:FHA domain-containing protein [Pandoraea sp.]|uniref:FHA domain-containing protein n=1 Tax=Pandoraea sp. TaxID=1883445 RepID=UPI0011FB3036|nr:FHA domain-containing protein [Pandoraea sp.]MDE2288754.1 EscD/YscD/HrpQ family type III secretion system inner membrane ring protein [Burkholderiales bacterium]TAL54274.1 MAG: EscD/YscD/HrpQ family type III secretion system inner membrane ring protein [Pandoraea sp.]TAM17170.1 MAG: EscD/YscD/HrpQ family type III secretion system inner membrane ring protein [Pandoraea sp.]